MSGTRRPDSSGAFAIAVAAGPFLLPVLGVSLGDLAFLVPLLAVGWGAAVCRAAARRNASRARLWNSLAIAGLIAVVASALAILTALAGDGETLGLYVGFAASVWLLLCSLEIARLSLREYGAMGMVDPLLLVGVPVSVVGYVVVAPAFDHGDAMLAAVVVVDLAALALCALGAMTSLPGRTRQCLIAAYATIVAGDALAAAGSAGLVDPQPWMIALLWAAGGLAFGTAAECDRAPQESAVPRPAPPEETMRHAYARALLPLGAVLSYPAAGIALAAATGRDAMAIAVFGALFIVSLVVAFARQAQLLVANRRAAARERRMRADAQRRTSELEALTAAAATMTETLEEGPMVERGLDALRVAARTTSSALHLYDGDRLVLRAATRAWSSEAVWAPPPQDGVPASGSRRGGRHIARLPLVARGRRLGLVTLVRRVSDAPFEGELDLLRLLVDQLAIALQNARDYREKLDLATRDPLTGVFNRRWFVEAFEKEIARHRRYGSDAALVMFDVDDFKSINDTLGHAAGDEVLREVCRLIDPLIRPADTFARTGGEEFWLLLPETSQLDALLVAERIRTAIARQQLLPGRQVTVSGGVAALGGGGHTREGGGRRAGPAADRGQRHGKEL